MAKPNPDLFPDKDPSAGFGLLSSQIKHYQQEALELSASNADFFFSLEEFTNGEWFNRILLCQEDITIPERSQDAIELLVPIKKPSYDYFLLRPYVSEPNSSLLPGLVEVNQFGPLKLEQEYGSHKYYFGWMDTVAIDLESEDDGQQALIELNLRLRSGFDVQPQRKIKRFRQED